MTDLIDNLDRRVQERTRDIQMAANVSTQVTTILEQDQLLSEVVTQLRDGFDFYTHRSISLMSLKKRWFWLLVQRGKGLPYRRIPVMP